MNQQSVLDFLRSYSNAARPLYLVGGAVRDVLLNRPVHDLDFVMPGPTREVARRAADSLGGGLYVLDEERDTTRVVLDPDGPQRLILDFATLRAGDLEGDLRARDFSINAMAFDIANPGQLIDPTGGLADLHAKRIRACSSNSLQADPVRVLRAVRQALSLQFRIDPDTLHLIRAAVPLLKQISAERQRDELFKILDGRRVSQAIQILDQLGALRFVLPELEQMKGVGQSAPHVEPVWEHTLAVISALEHLMEILVEAYEEEKAADLMNGLAVLRLGRFRERFTSHFAATLQPDRSLRALLFLAALYHDVGKPATRSEEPDGRVRFLGHPEQGTQLVVERGRGLALSNDEIQRLERMVAQHMRCHFLSGAYLEHGKLPDRRSIFRYFRDTGLAGVEVCLLSLADTRGTYGLSLTQEAWLAELEVVRALLEGYWEQSEQVISPPRLLTGNDLMRQFSLPPGRMIGRLLELIREGQAAGEITNQDDALEYARQWLAQQPAGNSATREG